MICPTGVSLFSLSRYTNLRTLIRARFLAPEETTVTASSTLLLNKCAEVIHYDFHANRLTY